MEIDLCDSPGVLVSPSFSEFPLAHNRMEMREATRRRVLVGKAPIQRIRYSGKGLSSENDPILTMMSRFDMLVAGSSGRKRSSI
jgi:hypothetical protein